MPAAPARSSTLATVLACAITLGASLAFALTPEVLSSARAVPPEVAGRFRDPRAFAQSASGQYFVFDRRGHRVWGIDADMTSAWEIVQLGPEAGRILEPTAFALAPNGSFVVADMPDKLERIQVFSPAGFRQGGFVLAPPARPHLTFADVVMSGVGTLQFTGSSVLLSQPENGWLVTEYSLGGAILRTFGNLRPTGHEDDREVHLALNSGIPLAAPDGGVVFVFQAGEPAFRKYDATGRLEFERRMEGREIDDVVANLPNRWMARSSKEEVPLVPPTIRTAAIDRQGRLWVSFMGINTYVYDRDGDKVRSVEFRGAGLLSPGSLFFSPTGSLLIAPGLYEFDPDAKGSDGAVILRPSIVPSAP